MGAMASKLENYRVAFSIAPPKNPRFTAEDVPDLTGRVAIVTGGNRGCGLITAKSLALRGARVYITSRDATKGQVAVAQIKEQGGEDAQVFSLQMDLSDLDSVVEAAKAFRSKEEKLNILILNAAVQEEPATKRTKQGYGLHFGVNVIAHFVLVKQLLPVLVETARTAPEGSVRIVTVASSAHYFAPKVGIDFASLDRKADQLTDKGKPWDSTTCYGHSKLANILVSNELAYRYADNGIYCLSLHPGNIWTAADDSWLARRLLWPADPYGAVNMLYCATSAEVVERRMNGKYVVPWARVHPPHPHGGDLEMAQKLWGWLDGQALALGLGAAQPQR